MGCRLLLLVCVTLGWACGVGGVDEDHQTSWAVFKWADTWSKTHTPEWHPPFLDRPRRRQDPKLFYAVREESPLLVKESLTSAEAAWVPEDEPLETIKENYAFGSRQFDHSFGKSPAFIEETVKADGIHPEPHTDTVTIPPARSHTYTTTQYTPQYPAHRPNYYPVPTLPHGRPRKYYLSGVMQEIKETHFTAPDLRKYYLHAGASNGTGPEETLVSVSNDDEDATDDFHTHDPSDAPTIYSTLEEHDSPVSSSPSPLGEDNSNDAPDTTHLQPQPGAKHSPYFPPIGYGHPPAYPPPLAHPPPYTHYLYQRPLHYTPSYYPPTPASFRKYHLHMGPATTYPPDTPDGNDVQDADDREAPSADNPSSFEMFDLLRRPRNTLSRRLVAARHRSP